MCRKNLHKKVLEFFSGDRKRGSDPITFIYTSIGYSYRGGEGVSIIISSRSITFVYELVDWFVCWSIDSSLC